MVSGDVATADMRGAMVDADSGLVNEGECPVLVPGVSVHVRGGVVEGVAASPIRASLPRIDAGAQVLLPCSVSGHSLLEVAQPVQSRPGWPYSTTGARRPSRSARGRRTAACGPAIPGGSRDGHEASALIDRTREETMAASEQPARETPPTGPVRHRSRLGARMRGGRTAAGPQRRRTSGRGPHRGDLRVRLADQRQARPSAGPAAPARLHLRSHARRLRQPHTRDHRGGAPFSARRAARGAARDALDASRRERRRVAALRLHDACGDEPSLRQAQSYVRVARRWHVRGYPGGMVPAPRGSSRSGVAGRQVLLRSVPDTLADIEANLSSPPHQRRRGGLIRPMMTPHATDTHTPETMRAMVAVARSSGTACTSTWRRAPPRRARRAAVAEAPAGWLESLGAFDGPSSARTCGRRPLD